MHFIFKTILREIHEAYFTPTYTQSNHWDKCFLWNEIFCFYFLRVINFYSNKKINKNLKKNIFPYWGHNIAYACVTVSISLLLIKITTCSIVHNTQALMVYLSIPNIPTCSKCSNLGYSKHSVPRPIIDICVIICLCYLPTSLIIAFWTNGIYSIVKLFDSIAVNLLPNIRFNFLTCRGSKCYEILLYDY